VTVAAATTAAPPAGAARRRDGLLVVRLDRLGCSGRVHGRAVVVTAVALAATAGVACWSLALGDFPVPLVDVVRALVGSGAEDSAFIVRTLRLPRALAGVLVGAAFGLAGAVFQRLARNPLASPDVVGVNAGATAAAVFVIVLLHGSGAKVTAAALAGGAGTTAAVYLLAYRRGITGYRFVLVGIGITAALGSVTSYLLTRAEIFDAQRAAVWFTGSLNGRSWADVRPVAIGLAVLGPLVLALARPLRVLELGDDAAQALGVRVEGVRAALLAAAAGLAAVGTASSGPIGFVALVSPQLARRLVGPRSIGLVPSAAVGALLLSAADLAGRRALAPDELPVGVVTAVLGAPYLLWLLARANRIGAAG
jgi:iron complex transport system permease protein